LSAVSVAFHSTEDLLNLLSMGVSLPADFFVKAPEERMYSGKPLGCSQWLRAQGRGCNGLDACG
jgi:hypothetical protein